MKKNILLSIYEFNKKNICMFEILQVTYANKREYFWEKIIWSQVIFNLVRNSKNIGGTTVFSGFATLSYKN